MRCHLHFETHREQKATAAALFCIIGCSHDLNCDKRRKPFLGEISMTCP
jgi:hypothetical protein